MKTEPFNPPPRPRLTQNALYWPAADLYLKSTHVHDFVGHEIELFPGARQSLHLDGGCEYSRVVSSGNPVYEDFSLWEDSPFEDVCQKMLWGTYGPKGDQPRRWVPLKECETEHLQAILRTQPHVYGTIIERVIKHVLKERGVKPAALEIPNYRLVIGENENTIGMPANDLKPAKKPVKRKARK